MQSTLESKFVGSFLLKILPLGYFTLPNSPRLAWQCFLVYMLANQSFLEHTQVTNMILKLEIIVWIVPSTDKMSENLSWQCQYSVAYFLWCFCVGESLIICWVLPFDDYLSKSHLH